MKYVHKYLHVKKQLKQFKLIYYAQIHQFDVWNKEIKKHLIYTMLEFKFFLLYSLRSMVH